MQVEPYFTTLALYDVKINKKITEDFHFDVNQPHIKTIIQTLQSNEPADAVVDVPADWLAFPRQVNNQYGPN